MPRYLFLIISILLAFNSQANAEIYSCTHAIPYGEKKTATVTHIISVNGSTATINSASQLPHWEKPSQSDERIAKVLENTDRGLLLSQYYSSEPEAEHQFEGYTIYYIDRVNSTLSQVNVPGNKDLFDSSKNAKEDIGPFPCIRVKM